MSSKTRNRRIRYTLSDELRAKFDKVLNGYGFEGETLGRGAARFAGQVYGSALSDPERAAAYYYLTVRHLVPVEELGLSVRSSARYLVQTQASGWADDHVLYCKYAALNRRSRSRAAVKF